MAATAGADFGSGLGSIIGGAMASNDLSNAQSNVSAIGGGFSNLVQPNIGFGQQFLPVAQQYIGNIANRAGNVESYDQFMSGYTNTPAAQYQLQQANAVQNSGAAANGQLLSGANERALGTIDNGIVAQNANQAYQNYLQGNNQAFGQLESSLGNMFNAIGVGTTATGQVAGVDTGQMNATSQIAQAQAKNDQSKGSGFGSLFSGLGSIAAAF